MDVLPIQKIPGLAGNLTATVGAKPGDTGTELPAAKVVVQAGASGSSADTPQKAPVPTLDQITEHRVTIDSATQQLVRESIDTRTNEVVSQFPDRSLLGLRAYLDKVAQRSKDASSGRGRDAVEPI